MKSKLITFALTIASASTSFGALYTVTTGATANSNGIAPTGLLTDVAAPALIGAYTGYQSPGTPGIVAYGVFSTLTSSTLLQAATKGQIIGDFTQFGASGSFNSAGPSGQKGLFSRASSATVTGSVFDAKNIYILVGNGLSFAESTEFLVLKNSTLFSAAQDAIPTPANVTITTANTELLFGRQIADLRTTTSDASVTPGWGTAIAVPEPSAALLGALGALGLLRRRRN
jgi:hypothetical protein